MRDVTDQTINSRTLNDASSIKKYLGTFGKDKPKKTKGRFCIGDMASDLSSSSSKAKKPANKKNAPRKSKSIVPIGTRCTCQSQRVQDVFSELRKLNLETYTNASALLIRTFLDLAVHNYLEKIGRIDEIVTKQQKKPHKSSDWAPTLRQMLTFLLHDVDLGIRGQPLTALKTFTSGRQDSLCLDGLDKFTHNKYLPPNVKDLQNIWVTIAPLMEILLVDPN